jgi:hypothetical protein
MESLTFFSVIRKSLFAIAIAVITVPASAHSLSNVDPLEKSADIKYLGSEDQALVFNVTYNNASASRFFVTIKDENGVTFFQGAFIQTVNSIRNLSFPVRMPEKYFLSLAIKRTGIQNPLRSVPKHVL